MSPVQLTSHGALIDEGRLVPRAGKRYRPALTMAEETFQRAAAARPSFVVCQQPRLVGVVVCLPRHANPRNLISDPAISPISASHRCLLDEGASSSMVIHRKDQR